MNEWMDGWMDREIDGSMDGLIDRWIDPSINQSINQSVSQSVNQSIIHSFIQSTVTHSVNQSVRQSVCPFVLLSIHPPVGSGSEKLAGDKPQRIRCFDEVAATYKSNDLVNMKLRDEFVERFRNLHLLKSCETRSVLGQHKS